MYFGIAVTCVWSYLELNAYHKDAFPVTSCIHLLVIIFGAIGAYLILPNDFKLPNQLATNKRLFNIFFKRVKSDN
jgi:hypothetical protein